MAAQSRTIIAAAGKTMIQRTRRLAAIYRRIYAQKEGRARGPASESLRLLIAGTRDSGGSNLPKLGPGQLPVHFAYGAIVRKMPQAVTRFFARLVFSPQPRY